jgi:integrase/recombinase XerD
VSQPIGRAVDDWIETIADTRSVETFHSYRYALRGFLAYLDRDHPRLTLDAMNMAVLRGYVESLHAQPLADRTRQQYVDVLCRWITALVEHGELVGVPSDRGRLLAPVAVRAQLERMLPRREPSVAPRIPDLRRLPAYYPEQLAAFLRSRGGRPPTEDEPQALRSYLNLLRNRALIATLFSTGGRVNEVLSLNTAQLIRHGELTDAVTIQGKGRKKRALYLNDEAREAISAYLRARQALFGSAVALFLSHGPRARGSRLSDVSAWRIVKEAAEALADVRLTEGADREEIAALRDISPHSLRHFFAQSMLDEGADYKDIAGALGHSSTRVTEQVYARQSDETILEVVATFAARPVKRFRPDDPTGDQSPDE